MNADKLIRKELKNYLENPHTHISFVDAVKSLPEKYYNIKSDNIPYTFWGLLEHIRISQYDMLDFIQNPEYKELEWPKDYWPSIDSKATPKKWKDSIAKFEKDTKDLKKIIDDPKIDLLKQIAHGHGQTILREVLQIIDHNSYHIGQFILMRRVLNIL